MRRVCCALLAGCCLLAFTAGCSSGPTGPPTKIMEPPKETMKDAVAPKLPPPPKK